MVVKISEKISYNFFCEKCNYKCNKKSEFNKHLLTAKHKRIVNGSEKSLPINKTQDEKFVCICGKAYKYDTGYYRHKKNCNGIMLNDNNLDQDKTVQTMIELIKQNNEFKQLLVEQNRQIIEMSGNMSTTTNNKVIKNISKHIIVDK